MKDGRNRHHLLWCRDSWSKGDAKRLRESLIFRIPIEQHDELHALIRCVPLPPEQELRRLLKERRKMPQKISLSKALMWLLSSAEDEAFLKAIAKQYVFFSEHELL